MTRDEIAEFCAGRPGAVQEFPFGDGVAVFKVGGRIFAMVPVEAASMTVKCEPELAEALRAAYPAVRPGYHTNKRHWNTVDLDGSIDGAELREMVEHAYGRVVSGLPRRVRDALPQRGRRTSG